MTSYTDVFRRKEKKYLASPEQRSMLEATFSKHLEPGEFGRTEIRSLYYDTPEFALIEHSLNKPLYKEKLRLRVYGTPTPDAATFVEIKKKFKGVVYKRRVPMSLAAAELYMDGAPYMDACRIHPLHDPAASAQSLSFRSIQISHEIDFMRMRNEKLQPSCLVRCMRESFIEACDVDNESNLRITFDDTMEFAHGAKSVYACEEARPILQDERAALSVLEVKSQGPFPQWLTNALAKAGVRPQSFSKYGTAYMNERRSKRA